MNNLPRAFSGVTIRTKTDVEALAESIERYAVAGHIAIWCVVPLLSLLKPHHWAAYARDASIPMPSRETIAAAIALFSEKIGYVPPGQTLSPPAHDKTSDTQPAIENVRAI